MIVRSRLNVGLHPGWQIREAFEAFEPYSLQKNILYKYNCSVEPSSRIIDLKIIT